MSRPPDTTTRPSLLWRLREKADDHAWAEFVRRYGPTIYQWCRHWNLQEADAQDVTQDVLLKLARAMRTFVYDPSRSFRGWLRTLTRHALSDFVADRRRPGRGSGDSAVMALLETVAAHDDLLGRLGGEFDREVLDEALSRVRLLRAEPKTWEAFRLLTEEGLSGAEVARRLGMKVMAVFQARKRVQEMVRQEVRALDPPDPQ
jgi:RNA polymerase sigma-70 factor (ECF subfamily)